MQLNKCSCFSVMKHEHFVLNGNIMKIQKTLFILLIIISALYAKKKSDTTVTWFAFNEAWSIVAEKNSNFIIYSDLKRKHPAVMNLFCRSMLEAENQIAFKLQIIEFIDSVYFGISFRSGNNYYDFLLSGKENLSSVTVIHRTLNIEEIISSVIQPLQTSIPVDTLWHDVKIKLSGGSVAITFGTSFIGKFRLPFIPEGKIRWGFAALYCDVALKDLYIVDARSESSLLSLDTGSIFTVPELKNRGQSGGKITGF